MYSHEIKELLKLKKNIVSIKEYMDIVSSPQIDHIKYDNGMFNIWTTDGYEFKLKLLYSNKK